MIKQSEIINTKDSFSFLFFVNFKIHSSRSKDSTACYSYIGTNMALPKKPSPTINVIIFVQTHGTTSTVGIKLYIDGSHPNSGSLNELSELLIHCQ